MAYMFEAVKIRYPEYYHEIADKQAVQETSPKEEYSYENPNNEDDWEYEP